MLSGSLKCLKEIKTTTEEEFKLFKAFKSNVANLRQKHPPTININIIVMINKRLKLAFVKVTNT